MNLRKWNSNAKTLIQRIRSAENEPLPDDNLSQDLSALSSELFGLKSEPSPSKLLGLNWNSHDDCFKFDFTQLLEYAQQLEPTKRSLLRILAKIFDPLGFLSPFTIRLKLMFQGLCVEACDWDTTLTGSDSEEWNSILKEIQELNKVKVLRYYSLLSSTPFCMQLHGFSDASASAYATVVYLCTVTIQGKVGIQILASKTKVAPIKKQSIPRL